MGEDCRLRVSDKGTHSLLSAPLLLLTLLSSNCPLSLLLTPVFCSHMAMNVALLLHAFWTNGLYPKRIDWTLDVKRKTLVISWLKDPGALRNDVLILWPDAGLKQSVFYISCTSQISLFQYYWWFILSQHCPILCICIVTFYILHCVY